MPDDGTKTITLTDRHAVSILEAEWPIIAQAGDHDNRYESQANRRWNLYVRQHADGRAIVYGIYSTQFENEHDRRGGRLLTRGNDIALAIKEVAAYLDFERDLADRCVADLPAETLASEPNVYDGLTAWELVLNMLGDVPDAGPLAESIVNQLKSAGRLVGK